MRAAPARQRPVRAATAPQPGNPGARKGHRQGTGRSLGTKAQRLFRPKSPTHLFPTGMASPNERRTCPPQAGPHPWGTQLHGAGGGGAWAPETAGASSLALHPGRLTMAGGLVHHHLVLIAQAALDEVEQGAVTAAATGGKRTLGGRLGAGRGLGGVRRAVPLPAVSSSSCRLATRIIMQ